MNIKCIGIYLGLAGAVLLSGCATSSVQQQSVRTGAVNAGGFSERRIDVNHVDGTKVSAAKSFCFRDRSGSPDKTTADVAQKASGILAQQGFTVMADNPNILVEIVTKVSLADKMGSSRVYSGTADVSVFIRGSGDDRGSRLLGGEQFEAKGARKFSESEARNSLSDSLARKITNWVAPLVMADDLGIAGTRFRAEQAFKELDREVAKMEGK
jgi:hypothetical protein